MPSTQLPDSLTVETVRFLSSTYVLEGELAYSDTATVGVLAVIAGPHPLLGGSMANNVVRALGDGLAREGVATLRFNYRGVGGSEGPPVHSTDRLAEFWKTSRLACERDFQTDLLAAMEFLHAAGGCEIRTALIGYSFGCSLLADPRLIDGTSALVLVAPTVGTHDYESFQTIAKPKLVIAPTSDFSADTTALRNWFGRLPGPCQLLQPESDGHFFRGHEHWLVTRISEFLLPGGKQIDPAV